MRVGVGLQMVAAWMKEQRGSSQHANITYTRNSNWVNEMVLDFEVAYPREVKKSSKTTITQLKTNKPTHMDSPAAYSAQPHYTTNEININCCKIRRPNLTHTHTHILFHLNHMYLISPLSNPISLSCNQTYEVHATQHHTLPASSDSRTSYLCLH
jgi:hypothetical protein